MAPKKEAALAVLPPAQIGTALSGTLDEKMRAFDQIAANLATLQLNGWDSAQKVKAGCWLADGAGDHPAIFMQNHYCMNIGGKLLIEPRWEYVNARIKSRLPGFRLKVIHKGNDYCEIYFADGRGNEHTEKYTMEYATTQGLASKDTYRKNPADLLFKQCFKRGADVIAADAVLGIVSTVYDYYENGSATAPTKSTAEVIDEALGKAEEEVAGAPSRERTGLEPEQDGTAVRPESDTAPVTKPTEPEEGPRARLYTVIAKMYGKVSKQVALEKASFLYNAMMEETTGLNPKVAFTKPGHIGPVEAEQILAYLAKREAAKNPAGSVVAHSGVDTDVPPASSVELVEDDEAPPPEKAAPTTDENGSAAADSYAALMQTVERARRLFPPRKFITEWPEGMGKMWYLDESTFTQAGHQAAVKIQVGPDIVAEPRVMDHLNEILAAACDARERGR